MFFNCLTLRADWFTIEGLDRTYALNNDGVRAAYDKLTGGGVPTSTL
jgi:hypothetical protein